MLIYSTAMNESNTLNSSNFSLHNPEVLAGLLDAAIILWTMNKSNLAQPHNFKYLEHIRSRVSRHFASVWHFFVVMWLLLFFFIPILFDLKVSNKIFFFIKFIFLTPML